MEPPVVLVAGTGLGDALRVADDEGADALVDAYSTTALAVVVRFGGPGGGDVPRRGLLAEFQAAAAAPSLRCLRSWCGASLVSAMDSFLGADRARRDQQRLIVACDGVGWMIPRSTPAIWSGRRRRQRRELPQ
jgi:hypothetical protein